MEEKELNESYEYNLKLYNESIRKDLDIILTSTIPIQKNLMKTILWINTSIIGLVLLSFREQFSGIWMVIPFLISLISILIILVSLKDGRVKTFGSPKLNELNEDKYMKQQGLLNLNQSYKMAFDSNATIVRDRGKHIARSIDSTILSILFIVILSILYYNNSVNLNKKEETMGQEDSTSETKSRPTKATLTSKPDVEISTNNTSYDSIYNESIKIQKSESTKDSKEKNSKNKE